MPGKSVAQSFNLFRLMRRAARARRHRPANRDRRHQSYRRHRWGLHRRGRSPAHGFLLSRGQFTTIERNSSPFRSGGPKPTGREYSVAIRCRVRCSFIKSEFRHRIMLAVSRPEPRSSIHSAGSDQCVAQLHRMALAVTSQVFSGATAQGGVYWDAEQSIEKSVECGMFRRASASPQFGGADGGVENQCVGLTEFEPTRHYGLVPASRYLYQDIRIGKDGHRPPSRSSLEPRRSSLTSSLLSAALARDFRIPTKLCIAVMRTSWRPRYRSRAACRTNAEIVVFSLRARAWSAPQS